MVKKWKMKARSKMNNNLRQVSGFLKNQEQDSIQLKDIAFMDAYLTPHDDAEDIMGVPAKPLDSISDVMSMSEYEGGYNQQVPSGSSYNSYS
jgi:hypothetical protein